MSPIRVSIESLGKVLSPEQLKQAGLPAKGDLELSSLESNTWLLTLSPAQTDLLSSQSAPLSPMQQKVLRLLKTHRLPDLIEGRFERFLADEELKAFRELIERGKIIVIKSNPKFDKGIYREAMSEELRAAVQTHASRGASFSPSPVEKKIVTHTVVEEKPVEEYSLVNDGFMVLRSDGAAKAASFDLQERIRAGEVKGIKTFDGFYYIIENSLLEKFTLPVVNALKAKKREELAPLSLSLAIPPLLTRIVLEFAKEDGLVIEKQKNMFAYVG